MISKRMIDSKGQKLKNKLKFEMEIMKKMDHPNIIKLESVFQNEEFYFIVLEYSPDGDLLEFIT